MINAKHAYAISTGKPAPIDKTHASVIKKIESLVLENASKGRTKFQYQLVYSNLQEIVGILVKNGYSVSTNDTVHEPILTISFKPIH